MARTPTVRHTILRFAKPTTITVIGTLVALVALAPLTANAAEPGSHSLWAKQDLQTVHVAAGVAVAPIVRDSYTVTDPPRPPPPPPPPPVVAAAAPRPAARPAVVNNPTGAQAIAADMVAARGWGAGEFDCLVALWNRESGWRVNAHNSSSGAHGIPQSLPGSKMASAGADWETNPATQITWGLGYISGRYTTPCAAWEHSERKGWY